MSDHALHDVASVGQMIRQRRKALGLKQQDLALVANVGIRFIVDVENGKETCQIGRVLRLMEALDIRLTGTMPDARPREPDIADDDEMGGLEL